jgi:SAM-dependent methyltransferase
VRPRSDVGEGARPWGMTGGMRTAGAIEAEVDEVQAWVGRVLPGGGKGLRVLEVGCGPGVLAERLLREGVDLTAIDVSEEQVAEARDRGVPAIVSDFLAFEASPFDALLFTRSLHHIAPLEAGRTTRSTRSPQHGSGTSRRCWRAAARLRRTCRAGITGGTDVMDTATRTAGTSGRTALRLRIRSSGGESATSTSLRCTVPGC